MKRLLRLKRLKIAEQILIVLVFAVFIPMAISAIVINNVNQQSIRTQLSESAIMIANIVSEGINLQGVNDNIFKLLKDDNRQIYVLNSDKKVVVAHNFDQKAFETTVKALPTVFEVDKPTIFSAVKNQPLVYLKKEKPNVLIVVNTTKEITKETITTGSFRIILSTLIASFAVIFVVGLYTYYLYINIRQLFKGIIAISKGSYGRRIRLLTNVFTPYEIIFLAFEFNRMSKKIKKSYLELKKKNKELKSVNEFRSNLIDTVSHEFRTPLTSIQGYTSRLLRQDIQIDEETKQKSLHTIKRQSERLKRMVEDLLVIPDIEGAKLRVNLEPIWVNETMKASIILVKNDGQKDIFNFISPDFPAVIADKDRLEQVFVNLLENAIKYADENTPILVDAIADENFAKIYIKNTCQVIAKDKLKTLFEKFTRIDDKTTRTTRGTGLGLFIVKGLVEAMDGTITLSSNDDHGFCVEVKLAVAKNA